MKMYKVPILFIVFKRKDVALETLKGIRKVRPAKLYIAGDGARPNVEGEAEKVAETRKAIIDAIDWPCDVKTLYHTENKGCCHAVYEAICWLFDNEEEGIIIEDDCVMRDSFFPFVEEMLERYRHDTRIGMIDAANYLPQVQIPDSYGFSRYKSTNGWATWRRAWRLMDLDMTWRGTPYEESILANVGFRSKDVNYWKYRIKAVDVKDVSAWDWQWYFTLAAHNMLGIYPRVSLTTNIGFGADATHTSEGKTPEHYISKSELEFPLRHPKYVVPYVPFENAFYSWNNSLFDRVKRLFPFGFKRFVKRIVRR